MHQYLTLVRDILENGEDREDRTGQGRRSVFGRQLRFNLEEGFPAVTTKKLAWKACKSELLWFLEGSNDERRLAEILYDKPRTELDDKTTIWSGNANAPYWSDKATFKGDLGQVYGRQWRKWKQYSRPEPYLIKDEWGDCQLAAHKITHIDQITNLITGLKTDPNSTRHIISAWNVAETEDMALPPCHVMSQFYVSKDKKLSCHMTQRSADVLLGIPFNIASYALLTHMIAQVCGYGVGDLVISISDAHLYQNHIKQAREQLTRAPLALPSLWLNPEIIDIDQFRMDDIQLVNYESHAAIKADMAV